MRVGRPDQAVGSTLATCFSAFPEPTDRSTISPGIERGFRRQRRITVDDPYTYVYLIPTNNNPRLAFSTPSSNALPFRDRQAFFQFLPLPSRLHPVHHDHAFVQSRSRSHYCFNVDHYHHVSNDREIGISYHNFPERGPIRRCPLPTDKQHHYAFFRVALASSKAFHPCLIP